VLVKLGPLDAGRVTDLRPYFDSVPDSRSRQGRWYSLTAILPVCACAVVSGARSLKTLGADNIAKTTRAIRDQPERALPLLGITNKPEAYGT
jgi:hypothetical protein